LVLIFALISFFSVIKPPGELYASTQSFGQTVVFIIAIECLNMGLFSLSSTYPVLNFVNYGAMGGILAILMMQFSDRRKRSA
jgi:hypothetical protein